jgi:hypothetical protein
VTLLLEAPAGRHFAQFHREPRALTDAVGVFLEAGVRRGNTVLIIATPDHTTDLLDTLNDRQLHPKALANSGQLATLDARTVLESVSDGTGPDWARFRKALAPELSRLQPFGRGTRVYTEMTAALWRDGDTESAIKIEELWNTLAGAFSFALYCGYTFDTQREECYASPLEELARTHSDILGTADDERFGEALDRASREIFGITLSQMAGASRQDSARRLPSGQRTMLWVTRNLPMSTKQLAERARHYYAAR